MDESGFSHSMNCTKHHAIKHLGGPHLVHVLSFRYSEQVGLGEGNLLALFALSPTNLLPMQLSEANEIHTESSIPSSHFFP
jgi:hypothetical protein